MRKITRYELPEQLRTLYSAVPLQKVCVREGKNGEVYYITSYGQTDCYERKGGKWTRTKSM